MYVYIYIYAGTLGRGLKGTPRSTWPARGLGAPWNGILSALEWHSGAPDPPWSGALAPWSPCKRCPRCPKMA